MVDTELLVIGAGPYALSTAALARDRGIETTIVGRPMAFWREHMPDEMFLRSGPDWHLDAAGVATLEAYLAEIGIDPDDVDPIPVGVFLDYAEWFTDRKGLVVREELVVELCKPGARFEAMLDSGEVVRAEFVVAAPGIGDYTQVPAWAAGVPSERSAHTCDLVELSELAGARVLIVGGRQSAYEWAALICEHGAARIDIVHRHDVPRFERVSWRFVDEHVERTLAVPGYWRNLPSDEQEAIDRRFWEVGRLTLEPWLTAASRFESYHAVARDRGDRSHRRRRWRRHAREPLGFGDTHRRPHRLRLRICALNSATFRTCAACSRESELDDGFPILDEPFQTTLDGLYITGYSATGDFGPFFGFVKGSPAAATLIVRDLAAKSSNARSSVSGGNRPRPRSASQA